MRKRLHIRFIVFFKLLEVGVITRLMENSMYRQANRSSFLGKPGSSCLASTYGKLVAIELTIKDELGVTISSGWQHDIQVMLTRFASHRTGVSAAILNSLATQLANKLNLLSCTNKSGTRICVPSNNYPYMRYVLHEWDGDNAADTKENDIKAVDNIAERIIRILRSSYEVTA